MFYLQETRATSVHTIPYHIDDKKDKRIRSPKMFEFQNSENFQTISAKFQNGRLTIIHSSLCSSCMHIDDQKKNEVQKSSKSENVQIPKYGKFPTTISAKYQTGSFTIIHSSLCSSCMHIDDRKKVQNSENIRIPKLGKFSNYFGKIPKWVGSKNSLVHPELWVCQIGRFPDLAIFPNFRDDLSTSQRTLSSLECS